jgi:hypothetical protein
LAACSSRLHVRLSIKTFAVLIRAERHVYRMAGVTDKVLPRLESMQPSSILDRVHDIEKYDRMARRSYGLSAKAGQTA